MRPEVAIALVPVLVVFSNDELKLLDAGVQISPPPAPFDKFADRIPETRLVCSFLPKVAAINLPPL